MKRAKFVGTLLVVTAMAMVAISLAPGRGLAKVGNRQRTSESATSENPSLAKNESEKRILNVLDDIREGPVRG